MILHKKSPPLPKKSPGLLLCMEDGLFRGRNMGKGGQIWKVLLSRTMGLFTFQINPWVFFEITRVQWQSIPKA